MLLHADIQLWNTEKLEVTTTKNKNTNNNLFLLLFAERYQTLPYNHKLMSSIFLRLHRLTPLRSLILIISLNTARNL
jgi:hypothetical protein